MSGTCVDAAANVAVERSAGVHSSISLCAGVFRVAVIDTYKFISHTKDIWVSGAIGIVELGLGHVPTPLLKDQGDCAFACRAQFIGPISNKGSVFFMKLSEAVWLSQGHELMDLP